MEPIYENFTDSDYAEAIIDTVREPLIVLDKTLHIVFANRSFYKLFNISPDEAIGTQLYELGHGGWNIPRLKSLLEKILSENHSLENYRIEHTFPHLGHKVLFLNAHKIWRDGNHVELILLAMEDVTKRQAAEKALRRSKANFRFIVEGVQDHAIVLLDAEGNISEWNVGAERLLGFSDAEAIGKSAEIIFTGEDRNARIPEKELETARKTGCANDERWHVRKDGSRFWGSGTVTPYYDSAGKPQGYIKIFRDMTEQKKIVETIARSNEELTYFASVASHDLKEPLRIVASYTELLARKLKDEKSEEIQTYIQYVLDGINRANQLINDLLEYSRSGNVGNLKPVHSEEILSQALYNLKMTIAEQKASIAFEHLPPVMGDAGSMLRLFQNLLSNAIKYHAKENPKIEVDAKKHGNEWLFSIKDNGIGIDEHHIDNIFKMFHRIPSKEASGAGIGLAICKKIVEGHGGRIWVKSKPGEGSIFYFTLPAVPKHLEEEMQNAALKK